MQLYDGAPVGQLIIPLIIPLPEGDPCISQIFGCVRVLLALVGPMVHQPTIRVDMNGCNGGACCGSLKDPANSIEL